MNTLYITIGNIGSGKTTWVRNFVKENPNTLVISKDDIRRMLHAGEYVYDERIETELHRGLLGLLDEFNYVRKDIIIDETNMSREERADFIDYGTYGDYKMVAVVMPEISREEAIFRRMKSNHGDTPEEVWTDVWNRKDKEFEPPTFGEGFDQIIHVSCVTGWYK